MQARINDLDSQVRSLRSQSEFDKKDHEREMASTVERLERERSD